MSQTPGRPASYDSVLAAIQGIYQEHAASEMPVNDSRHARFIMGRMLRAMGRTELHQDDPSFGRRPYLEYLRKHIGGIESGGAGKQALASMQEHIASQNFGELPQGEHFEAILKAVGEETAATTSHLAKDKKHTLEEAESLYVMVKMLQTLGKMPRNPQGALADARIEYIHALAGELPDGTQDVGDAEFIAAMAAATNMVNRTDGIIASMTITQKRTAQR